METPMLTKKQFNRISKYLPLARVALRINDLIIISGIIFVFRHGIPWRLLPAIYGNWNTVYSRFNRWSSKGIFLKIFLALGYTFKKRNIAMLDSTTVHVHRTATSMRCDGKPREIGKSRGGWTTKIHLLCTSEWKPLYFCITEGQESDVTAAPEIIDKMSKRMTHFLGDRGYDSDRLREQLVNEKIIPCIPGRSNRKKEIQYDKELYKKRHIVENMFGRLKDWRGIGTRYCRCAHTFETAVCIAFLMLFY